MILNDCLQTHCTVLLYICPIHGYHLGLLHAVEVAVEDGWEGEQMVQDKTVAYQYTVYFPPVLHDDLYLEHPSR